MRTLIGRYRLGELLGTGGSGQVYRAKMTLPSGVERELALKVLHEAPASLRREARIGGMLRHQNIVDVFELGEDRGLWFCAMELCDGGVISAYAPLPPRAVVEVGIQVCEALLYAHRELGLVHQDIKPDNLLLSDGMVKVADLGIASARGFGSRKARGGTPGYMAPEQWAGAVPDRRADLFSLAVTLIVLSTGQPPRASETLDWTSLDDPPDISPLSEMPAWLIPALEPCLATEPSDRWPDAEALLRALRRLEVTGPGLREAIGWQEPSPAPDRARGRLPLRRPTLLGRDRELSTLLQMMSQPGALLLKALGGMGKTQLACALAEAWTGPSCFIDLTTALDPKDLIAAVAEGLDVALSFSERTRWPAQIGQTLASRGPLLLVLDNFEQLEMAAPLVSGWLSEAPQLRIVVTSRARIPLPGAALFELPPLDALSSTQLICDRAAERGVVLTPSPALTALASHLEGVPLALELAAGRLGVLTVQDILTNISLGTLRAGSAGRHGTLEATLRWSWELLEPSEQRALARLSVFEGSFAVEHAEAVLADLPGVPIDLLGALHAHSLLAGADANQLRLLLLVKDFAATRLHNSGEARSARDAHSRSYARLGRPKQLDTLQTAQGTQTRTELRAARQNLIAACRHAIRTGNLHEACAAYAALQTVLETDGRGILLVELGEAIHALGPPPDLYAAHFWMTWGNALRLLGRLTESIVVLETAWAAVSEARDELGLARLQFIRGLVHYDQGHLNTAVTEFASAESVFNAHGLVGLLARARQSRANALSTLGQQTTAAECYLSALTLSAPMNDKTSTAIIWGNYGNLLRTMGRLPEAVHAYTAAIEAHRSVGNAPMMGHVLGNLAYLQSMQGQYSEALELYNDAMLIATHHGDRASECILLVNIGICHLRHARLPACQTALEEAIRIARDCGFTLSRGYAQVHLARARSRAGHDAPIIPLLNEGAAVLYATGSGAIVAEALAIEAEVLHQMGDTEAAKTRLQRARRVLPVHDQDTTRILNEAERFVLGD